MTTEKENSKPGRINALWIGIKAGILSSLCCIPVIILVPILVLLGAQSFALAFVLTKYRTYFIILGFLFVLISFRTALKRRYGCCDTKVILENKYIIAVAITTQILFFLVSYYVVLPAVSNYVFTTGLGSQLEEDYATTVITAKSSTTTLLKATTVPQTTVITTTVGASYGTTTFIKETCFDGILNQDEERVDCGGPCSECGTMGVLIHNVSECTKLKFNEIYLNVTDFEAKSKTWRDSNPVENFKVFCDNQTIKNLVILERKNAGDHYGKINFFRKPIESEYRLKVSCNREHFIEDLQSNCPTLKVRVEVGGDWGEGVWYRKNLTRDLTVNSTSIETASSITTVGPSYGTTTPPTTTTTLQTTRPGYSQITLKLNTYCPTCIPAAKYLLSTTKGVVSSKFPDPKKKIWIVEYNENITNPKKIMSRVRDFDPILI